MTDAPVMQATALQRHYEVERRLSAQAPRAARPWPALISR